MQQRNDWTNKEEDYNESIVKIYICIRNLRAYHNPGLPNFLGSSRIFQVA